MQGIKSLAYVEPVTSISIVLLSSIKIEEYHSVILVGHEIALETK